MKNNTNKIIEEFEKKYNTDGCGKALVILENNESGGMTQRPAYEEIKQVILKALKSQRQEIIEEIEKMKKSVKKELNAGNFRHIEDEINGYNQALQDIINSLK